MIDNCNIKKLAKNQVSAVFHSRAIRRSVLPKFTELCMDPPLYQHGGPGNQQQHLSLSFATKA